MMHPDEVINYLKNCKRTFKEANADDKKSIQLLEELFQKHLLSKNQNWIMYILSELGISKDFLLKLGYDIDTATLAQDKYFYEINKRFYVLKDKIDEIDQVFALKLLTDIVVIDKNIDTRANIQNLIVELHYEQFKRIKGYFELVVKFNFDEVKEILKNSDQDGANSVSTNLGKLVNKKHAEMISRLVKMS